MNRDDGTSVTTVPILMYHSVTGDRSRRPSRLTVSFEQFTDQMLLLYERRYVPVTISQLASHLRDPELRPLVGRPVAITFDDGFADFASHALGVLQSLSFRSTLYVTTGFIGENGGRPKLHPYLSAPMLMWNQIGRVIAAGTEIGSHGCKHIALDLAPKQSVVEEIERSKEVLEQRLGVDVQSFAYPFGYTGALSRRLVEDAGYTSACAVKHGLSSSRDDVFALTRVEVTSSTSLCRFDRWLQGIGLPIAPSRPRLRTTAWRVTRRLALTGRRAETQDVPRLADFRALRRRT